MYQYPKLYGFQKENCSIDSTSDSTEPVTLSATSHRQQKVSLDEENIYIINNVIVHQPFYEHQRKRRGLTLKFKQL